MRTVRLVRRLLEQVGKWVSPTGTGTADEGAAVRAAEKLKKKLGNPKWLDTVGVGYSTFQGFYVTVLYKASSGDADEQAAWEDLPTDIDGIKVLPSAAPTNQVVGDPRYNYAYKVTPGADRAGSLHQGAELLDDLAFLVCEALEPAHVERVALMLTKRFQGRDWFVSAKANRAKDGVRLNIKTGAHRPNIPKEIQRVPVRVERSQAKPKPAPPVFAPAATTEMFRVPAQRLFEAPPGTPPKITPPGTPAANDPFEDPLIATAVVGFANARLTAGRLKTKAITTPGNMLPSPDEDKDDDAAAKSRDALMKIAKGRGIAEPRLRDAMRQKLPPPTGPTGTYKFDPIKKTYTYR